MLAAFGVMGFLLFAALIWLAAELWRRAAALEGRLEAAEAQARPVAVPAGARVEDMTATEAHVVLRLGLADGRTLLLVIDPPTGRVVARLELTPGAQSAHPPP